jgi:uncharacterized protein
VNAENSDYPRIDDKGSRIAFKYTVCISQRCNLACPYCYIGKTGAVMSRDMLRKIIRFIYRHVPAEKNLDIGLFGGEPLLDFPIVKETIHEAKTHPDYTKDRVSFSLTTNGTIFSDEIATFLRENRVRVCISCDGPADIHDRFRRTRDGLPTASLVEKTICQAIAVLPELTVNAVFNPQTFRRLNDVVHYFSGIGIRDIHINPDFSARWTARDAEELHDIYHSLAESYIQWRRVHDPHVISLLETKIGVLIRGGYLREDRCQVGAAELAFSPDGGIYPCERLIENGKPGGHRIGHIDSGIDLARLAARCARGGELNDDCLNCGMRSFCCTWCGCSNHFMTGYYNRVGPILCASERAAIDAALYIFTELKDEFRTAVSSCAVNVLQT